LIFSTAAPNSPRCIRHSHVFPETLFVRFGDPYAALRRFDRVFAKILYHYFLCFARGLTNLAKFYFYLLTTKIFYDIILIPKRE